MKLFLITFGPIAIFLVIIALRLVAAAQPETTWSGKRRARLNGISYVLMVICGIGLICLIFIVPPAGIILSTLAIGLSVASLEAEVRIAGVRNRAQQVEFLWVLALAVRSGRPLADEIEAYARGTWGRRHRLMMEMAERIRDGVPLTEIVVPQGLLPRSATMQIHAGITSKSLQESLQATAVRFTQHLTEDQSSTHPGKSLVYPASIVAVMVLIVGFLMYYIIPKFKKIFDDFGTELPAITISLIRASDTFINYWYLVALPFVYFAMGTFVYTMVAEYHGWRVMSQSLFGRWFVRWHSPDILRSLSQSLSQGVPIDQALASIAKHAGQRSFRERVTRAEEAIRGGAPSWQSLQKSGILTFHEAVLFETAERVGNLPWVLETLAGNIEHRWSFRFQAFLEILNPAVLLAVSLIVGFIVIAMFMPLIKLLNDLS